MDEIILIVISICISISTTLMFLLFGHIANPSTSLPHSMQMLVSNIIFDGLTVFFTLRILGWAIKNERLSRIFVAIFIDLIVAAILACLSLFFALAFSEYSLSIRQILFVLIAKSQDGTIWDIGPYFWVMHTTFIPTLIYLFIILLCCWGKALVVLPYKHFDKVRKLKNPLSHTVAVFSLVSWIFGGVAVLIFAYIYFIVRFY